MHPNISSDFIQEVLTHESFPHKPFYWATGKQAKDAVFYVRDGEVRSDFVNSKGQPMYFYFYFVQPAGFNPYLICGAKFA